MRALGKETMSKKLIHYLGSAALVAALAAPLALQAQDRDDHHDRDDHDKHRVYDRDHKDYHQWNDDENRRYREWYEQSHRGKEYREFDRLNHHDQDSYWKWRHDHDDRR